MTPSRLQRSAVAFMRLDDGIGTGAAAAEDRNAEADDRILAAENNAV